MSATTFETQNGRASRYGRSGGVCEYISPSRLNTWLSCPLKFKLRYIDGIRSPSTPSLFIGKQVHAALEVWNRHRMLGVMLDAASIADRMASSWDQAVADEEMKWDSIEQSEMAMKQTSDLVNAYLAQVREDESSPLAVEATLETPLVDPFTGEDLGIPLLGVVDLIEAGEEGPRIVDFKTSSRSAPPFDITTEIQLSCYSHLYRETTGMREQALEIRSLIKTKKPKIERHEYAARSESHLRRLFAVIREYLDALDRGKFNYRPGWGCSMCENRDGPCRDWAG